MSDKALVARVNADPRVVRSRAELAAIPRWRLIAMYRAQRNHIGLYLRVERQLAQGLVSAVPTDEFGPDD